jgi:putative copper resistance protein D
MFETIDLIDTVIKAVALLFVLQAAGTAIFAALYGKHLENSFQRIRALGMWSAAIGAMCVLLYQALEAGRMAGELAGVWDGSLQAINWMSANASASLVRVLGCILIGVGLRASRMLELVGALTVIASFMMTGHLAVHELRWLLMPMLLVHVAVAAFWLGALPALIVLAKHEPTTPVITQFSTHATICVPLLALVGGLMAWTLLPSLAALGTPYGLAILAKANGFTLLLGLAAVNKLRLAPAMQRGETRAATVFISTVKLEYAVITIVLSATAAMTLFSPD